MECSPESDIASLKERRTELSNTINRIMFTLLSFGFFCALTLTQPDEMVIRNGGKIRIPFFRLNAYIPVSVSGANLANLNLMGFRLAGAQAEKAVFNDSVFYRMELSGLYAPHAEFKNANLIGATLNQSDLGSANFEKAKLSWSSLKGSMLANVVLREAEIVDADLTESVLESANLEKADLSGAIFRMAHLNRARFGGADLSGAVFDGAVLIGTDLGRAKNLTQAQLDMACGDKDTILAAGLSVKECFRN